MGSASGAVPTIQQQPDTFRGIAGHLVTGVSVVVTLVADEPFATTAGSIVAASWDPPLLAVFFQGGSRMAAALDQAERFTINVLGAEHHALAQRFARPDRIRGWAAISGVHLLRRDPSPPLFSAALAWADCALVQTIPIGDHRCFIGEVLAAGRNNGSPLAYYRGRFRGLGPAIAPPTWLEIEMADAATIW